MLAWAHKKNEFDHALSRAGRLNADPVLTAYLEDIMDRLYPEFKGKRKGAERLLQRMAVEEVGAFDNGETGRERFVETTAGLGLTSPEADPAAYTPRCS